MKAFSWTEAPHGAVVADGRRLETAAFGPAPDAAPTIMLLHEGLGCVSLWRDVPERLAQATGFGVLAFSRAGYGRSDPVPLPRPLDYMTREARDVLPVVLGAVGVRRCVLVGHSDGASIAAIHAGLFDDARVCGLVLIAPHVFTEEPGLAAIAEARRAWESGDLRARLAKHHAHVNAAFLGWNDAWLDPGFRSWTIAEHIERWRVPALVVQGDCDQYGTLAQVRAIEARAAGPVETLILEGCRHAPQFEAPEPTLAAIARFCLRAAADAPPR